MIRHEITIGVLGADERRRRRNRLIVSAVAAVLFATIGHLFYPLFADASYRGKPSEIAIQAGSIAYGYAAQAIGYAAVNLVLLAGDSALRRGHSPRRENSPLALLSFFGGIFEFLGFILTVLTAFEGGLLLIGITGVTANILVWLGVLWW